MGTEFGKPGKATKNGDFIQWARGEMFKTGEGLLQTEWSEHKADLATGISLAQPPK